MGILVESLTDSSFVSTTPWLVLTSISGGLIGAFAMAALMDPDTISWLFRKIWRSSPEESLRALAKVASAAVVIVLIIGIVFPFSIYKFGANTDRNQHMQESIISNFEDHYDVRLLSIESDSDGDGSDSISTPNTRSTASQILGLDESEVATSIAFEDGTGVLHLDAFIVHRNGNVFLAYRIEIDENREAWVEYGSAEWEERLGE